MPFCPMWSSDSATVLFKTWRRCWQTDLYSNHQYQNLLADRDSTTEMEKKNSERDEGKWKGGKWTAARQNLKPTHARP